VPERQIHSFGTGNTYCWVVRVAILVVFEQAIGDLELTSKGILNDTSEAHGTNSEVVLHEQRGKCIR
jgi:hypothetical protein